IAVLQLINARDWQTGEVIRFSHISQPLIESLSSQAAVALNNQQLMEAQRKLLDAFIEVIAGAIDAKSPYTGGHCQRVPELARMLSEAAGNATNAPFADFTFSEDDRYELNIASLLHDCGKVTTPEYVVDKATKLETIYNRIHEVRTRFEVLKRDAEIAYLKALNAGEGDPETLKAAFDARIVQLDDDFRFIADANIGGEFMDDADIERVRRIAGETWVRTIDDRLGLSHTELERYDGVPHKPLPVEEHLLADRKDHLIPRPYNAPDYNAGGFEMDVPENLYNLGEVYNLIIKRGTLTEEERFKINEHIIQTIVMLEQLPFPRHLKRVPEYAGGHHEKMDGTGYPRRLSKESMSVTARIMAIADIFEALTASDRPYKKAKKLSEAVKIMSFMAKDAHIDKDLFKLFLESGVHIDYAKSFLKPEQLDDVDITQYIGS
ncbi:MAG: HD domain-containing protein, partial [Rhodospirillales bacterium]|nr:HD domain-containing protein [Rhodospirillales bacterium]